MAHKVILIFLKTDRVLFKTIIIKYLHRTWKNMVGDNPIWLNMLVNYKNKLFEPYNFKSAKWFLGVFIVCDVILINTWTMLYETNEKSCTKLNGTE